MASRAAVLVTAATACGVGAWLGAWWVPFVTGLGAGALGGGAGALPRRGLVLTATVGAACGWLTGAWLARAAIPRRR